jgi:hypothetical protein
LERTEAIEAREAATAVRRRKFFLVILLHDRGRVTAAAIEPTRDEVLMDVSQEQHAGVVVHRRFKIDLQPAIVLALARHRGSAIKLAVVAVGVAAVDLAGLGSDGVSAAYQDQLASFVRAGILPQAPDILPGLGIDGEIGFKDDQGQATGRRLYIQLKSGDSYLKKRKTDGAEVFQINNPRWVAYWQKQAYAVMLVIRTSNGEIRWME